MPFLFSEKSKRSLMAGVSSAPLSFNRKYRSDKFFSVKLPGNWLRFFNEYSLSCCMISWKKESSIGVPWTRRAVLKVRSKLFVRANWLPRYLATERPLSLLYSLIEAALRKSLSAVWLSTSFQMLSSYVNGSMIWRVPTCSTRCSNKVGMSTRPSLWPKIF